MRMNEKIEIRSQVLRPLNCFNFAASESKIQQRGESGFWQRILIRVMGSNTSFNKLTLHTKTQNIERTRDEPLGRLRA